MQRRIRKKRSRSSDRESRSKIRRKEITCLREVILLPLFLIALTSCTHLNKPKISSLKEFSKKICFTGDGKGRITVPEGRYVINYESLKDTKKKTWLLAIDIPLKGEELLKVDYSRQRVRLSGSFTKRLAGIQQNRKLSIAFAQFLQKIRILLCEGDDSEQNWSLSESELNFQLSNNYQVKIEGLVDNGSHFERVNFLLFHAKENEPTTSFELFTSNCTQ